MSGPAMSGAFIYAKNVGALAAFYVAVADLKEVHVTEEMAVLNAVGLQLVIHKMPSDIDASVKVPTPPSVRDSAIKLFFGVESIDLARVKAEHGGGEVNAELWNGPGFNVCNAIDPEGNVFQVREPRT